MYGGAVGHFHTAAQYERCTFEGNNASEEGGALSVVGGTDFDFCATKQRAALAGRCAAARVGVRGSVFRGNAARQSGGAVNVVLNAELSLSDCVAEGNEAVAGAGGAVVMDSYRPAPLRVDRTVFDGNTAGAGCVRFLLWLHHGGLHRALLLWCFRRASPVIHLCLI